jgi:hypothetical protein
MAWRKSIWKGLMATALLAASCIQASDDPETFSKPWLACQNHGDREFDERD